MYRFGARDKLCWMPCFKTRDRFTEVEEGKGATTTGDTQTAEDSHKVDNKL